VQTVAAATEELTGSIAEIARQVHDSARIAGEAVREANVSGEKIRELPKARRRSARWLS